MEGEREGERGRRQEKEGDIGRKVAAAVISCRNVYSPASVHVCARVRVHVWLPKLCKRVTTSKLNPHKKRHKVRQKDEALGLRVVGVRG